MYAIKKICNWIVLGCGGMYWLFKGQVMPYDIVSVLTGISALFYSSINSTLNTFVALTQLLSDTESHIYLVFFFWIGNFNAIRMIVTVPSINFVCLDSIP